MMKKLVLSLFFSFLAAFGLAQDFPAKPSTLVNDYTNTLTSAQKQALEDRLVAFNDSTTIQIAVVLIKTTGDYDINQYAMDLGRKWGVGGKEKNTGVMLLVAIGDRKLAIQTGYGMEGILPDIYTQRIIQNDIKPLFKDGDYFGGINAGVNAIIAASKGEYKNEAPVSVKSKRKDSGGSWAFIVFIIIAIIIAITRGGRGGGGGRVIGSRGVSDALFWGLLLGSGRRDGGGFGGGGFGGGSSGGGGFGGFGGGSFGGGGSSGSW